MTSWNRWSSVTMVFLGVTAAVVVATESSTSARTTSTPSASPTTTTTTVPPSSGLNCNTTAFAALNASVFIVPAAAEELQPTIYQVPRHQQEWNYTCGPASLYAALGAFGLLNATQGAAPITEKAIAQYMGTNWDVGTYTDSMATGARYFGLAAEPKNRMTFDDVQRALWRGNLVLVCYELCRDNETIPWPLSYDNGHYSVVYGLDAANIYLMDPWSGNYGYVPRARWLTQWHCGGELNRDGAQVLQRWGMTVRPVNPDAIPTAVSLTQVPPVFQVSVCPGDI